MKIIFFSFLLCYIKFSNGECPTIPNITDFNATRFAGKWYEIQRLNNSLINEDCGEPTYTLKNNSYKVEYLMRNIASNTSKVINMVLEPFGIGAYNILIDENKDKIPHNILETDYTSYSVVWGCDKEHGQRLFIYSRNSTLNANHNASITELLTKLSITEQLVTVEQDKIKCNRNNGGRTFPIFGKVLLIYLSIQFM